VNGQSLALQSATRITTEERWIVGCGGQKNKSLGFIESGGYFDRGTPRFSLRAALYLF
jgi:hypothetical protein